MNSENFFVFALHRSQAAFNQTNRIQVILHHTLLSNVWLDFFLSLMIKPCRRYMVLSLWENEPTLRKPINIRLAIAWPLSKMVVTRYICDVLCLCYAAVTVKSAWWLLMTWCLYGTGTSETIIMVLPVGVYQEFSRVVISGLFQA